ncbi:MAG: mannose-1-phosphate guanylyltransferase [Patescibacteria group bacterium]
MIIVIIAGGSGTRLWPLSTPDYPKHLLKINGDERSLLQNTYDRAKLLTDKIYVVPEIGHAHHVREQLSELPDEAFIVEPARRGTASCVIAALMYVASRHDSKEPIAFISADHYIRDSDGFVATFSIAADVSAQQGRIVLIGVEPDYPATGFGYIQKDAIFDDEKFVYNVHSFKEKPDHKLAQKYLKSGNYLWNCSYFIGSLDTFLHSLKEYAPNMAKGYEELLATKTPEAFEEVYLALENNSIDYALMEKVKDLLVIPAAFDWMDVGSFNDIHKAVESDEQRNHVHGEKVELEGVENSFIQNHEDKPLAVIGLNNVAVINTPHGLLVTRKDLAQQVGEVSKRFKK